MTERELTFEAPAPGAWELEVGHHGRRPLSGFIAQAYVRGFETGTEELCSRYGLPLERVRGELVHGCTYVRPVGVGEGKKPKPAPPTIVMKVLARLHPELRRRNKTAARAWEQKQWRADVDRWFDHDRAQVTETNLAFQRVDLAALDDDALLAHVVDAYAHFEAQARANMANHGGDLMPIGDFLAHCARWGISFGDASALLRGSSPATTVTATLSPDEWLERHAWRTLTTDDIDRPTLAERPALVEAAKSAAAVPEPTETPDPSAVRAAVPAQSRALFDELLIEARYGLRQRDEPIVGTRWNWSAGLLRRALLEVGRRLTERGLLLDAEHAVELSPDEVGPLLRSGTGPTAADIAARVEFRDRVEAAGPPMMLGDPEEPPPLDALPAPMARATAALMTMLEADFTTTNEDPLAGIGIGSEPYQGRARVVTSADDALERLEPGDVLVARFIGPAYNSILPILGGLVVEIGGAMCHAAIVSREFGLPAIIGAAGATSEIADGALVEVDPARGLVRVVATAG